jgi:hypothetical protein
VQHPLDEVQGCGTKDTCVEELSNHVHKMPIAANSSMADWCATSMKHVQSYVTTASKCRCSSMHVISVPTVQNTMMP